MQNQELTIAYRITANGLAQANGSLSTSQNAIETIETTPNETETIVGHLLNGHTSDYSEINNICDSLSSQLPRTADPFNLVGWIRGHSRDSFELYHTDTIPNHPVASERRPGSYRFKGLRDTQRVELARRAALCFLQVISTSWAMSEPQNNEGIFLDPGLSSTQPREMGIYVSHIFMANGPASQTQNSSISNSLPHLTYPALYKFSLLLIELCLVKSIDDPRNPEKSFRKVYSLMKKKRPNCKIQSKFGKQYKAAIKFCFDQSIEKNHPQDLPKIFEEKVYDSICESCGLVEN